jgi:hypothetical protein
MDPKTGEQAALIGAFRQGLELSGLAVIRNGDGIRLATVGPDGLAVVAPGETGEVRFWCRRTADAERVFAAAATKLRRQSFTADQAIIAAAARLHVALYTDEQITGEAIATIARMEEEFASLQRSGALKSVNRAYRLYRQDASARGEKIVPYVRWLGKYKENLVRQLAAALRYF